MRRPIRLLALICLAVLGVAGCGSTSSSSSTTSTASTQKVPNSALVKAGTLTVCQSVPSEPFLMYNSSGQVIGTDADTAADITKWLGLKEATVLSVFATMITAVQTGKCDVIISSMDVRADREAQIDQIGYLVTAAALLFKAGQTYGMGTPVSDEHSLCGHSIAAEIGSEGLDQINTWSAECTAAGLPAISTTDVEDNTSLYELLIEGKTQAAIGSPEAAGYYAVQHPGTIADGPVYSEILEGIGVKKGNLALEVPIINALKALQANGTLLAIMKKYGCPATDVPSSFAINPPINSTETSGEPTPPSS